MSQHEPAFMRVQLNKIDPGTNVRIEPRQIEALAESIRKNGVLQPITVVLRDDGDGVECLFGHRRLAAARIAGLETIPCLARPRDRAESRVLAQIAENRDRLAMSHLEEALAYDELRKLGMSQQRIAEAVGTTQSAVSQRLLLLKYPECVQRQVHNLRLGIADALAIPLELATKTDGRTLNAVCARGGKHVRTWVQRELRDRSAKGQKIAKGRQRYFTLNIDSDLEDAVHDAADRAGITIVQWARQVVSAALDAQAASAERTNA